MPLVQQLYDEYQDEELVVLTIHLGGSPAVVTRFLADGNYTFTTLVDTDKETGREYGLQYVPTTFFIDREGLISERVIGGFENREQIDERLRKILS